MSFGGPIIPTPSPIQPIPAQSTPGYNQTTMAQALAMLSARLGDPANTYWSLPELRLYIIEALRTWNALTSFYRTRIAPTIQQSIPWVDLTETSALPQTVKDVDIAGQILYCLLEAQLLNGAWTGTDQFTLGALQTAIQNRINRFLSDSGAVVSVERQLIAAAGRVYLDPTIIDVRRVAWTLPPPTVPTGLTISSQHSGGPVNMILPDPTNQNQLVSVQLTYSLLGTAATNKYYSMPWPGGSVASTLSESLVASNSNVSSSFKMSVSVGTAGGYANGYYLFYPPILINTNSGVSATDVLNTFPQAAVNYDTYITLYATGKPTFGVPLLKSHYNTAANGDPNPSVPASGGGGVFATAAVSGSGVVFRLQEMDGLTNKILEPLDPGIYLKLSFTVKGNPTIYTVIFNGNDPSQFSLGFLFGPNAIFVPTGSITASPGDLMISFQILGYSNPHDAEDANNRVMLLDILPYTGFFVG